ncbi:MAG: LytR C-terminal domain-containing protein [Sinomonas sp.]|jgi:hypothetical protein|nr:LytR C-terminal domain-containing protein [Sinomonas sp.]
MSTYPRDEFDDVPEAPRRQGVHRAKAAAEQGRRGIAWVLVAAAAVVILVAAALFLVPKLLGTAAAPSASASSAQPKASSSASAPVSASPSTSPTQAAESSATPTSSASSGAPSQADRTLQVGVYNATGTAGLGNRAAAAARNAGWTVATVGNWTGSPVSASVVFYRDPSQKASAQALAADLGIATVLQAQQLGYPLAAVVGPGYTG